MHWLTQQFELSRGGGRNERPMEGLRGFAVFLVFLVHFVTLSTPWISGSPWLFAFTKSIHAVGNSGVDLFFVLSGYLIYGSLISRRQSFSLFIMRRIKRIYPAFTTVFIAYIFLSFAFPSENKIPSPATDGFLYLLLNLLLLPGIFPIEPLITVAWSLSYEMFYYMAIPLTILLFRLRGKSPIFRTIFFLSIAFLIAVYCALYGGHIRLIMFISGIVLYEATNTPHLPAPSSTTGLIALLTGLLGTLIPLDGPVGFVIKVSILFFAFFALCLTCFRNHSSWLPAVFSWTPLRWLGNMSYSYYLLHGLALKAGFLTLSMLVPTANYGAWLFLVLLPAMFVVTVILSAALFLLVERPFSLAPRRMRDNSNSPHAANDLPPPSRTS